MKKGFTLIELLAVIVILAIIALIATPIILGIINDAKKQSKQRTAELVAKEVELAYTSYVFKNTEGTSEACNYLNENFFEMNNLKEISCDGNESIVTMNNNDEYTIIYEDGIVTVKGATKDVVINLGKNESSSKQVVYRYTGDELYIGDSIENVEVTTDPTTLGIPAYLKHEVEDNIITASYACIGYTEDGKIKEACIQGGDFSYFGTYDGMSNSSVSEVINPTGNVAIINSNRNFFEDVDGGSCQFSSRISICNGEVHVIKQDTYDNKLEISVGFGDGPGCYINYSGKSYCRMGYGI